MADYNNRTDCFAQISECKNLFAGLRGTLLPKLVSGEVRVPEVEKLMEQAL